jgi:hypothetical protein
MSTSERRAKSSQFGVRVSPDEAREIRVRAECGGVSPGAFLLAVYRRWRRLDNRFDTHELDGG